MGVRVSDVPVELQRRWLDRLHAEWGAINRRYLEGRLRRPVILLEGRSHRLGAWEASTRTIWIGVAHLVDNTWHEVRDTLRHEVAHQVVSEIFGESGAPAHGKAFDRACRMLGMVCQARAAPRVVHEETRRVLRRVTKLLNLSRSSNPHEAEAAMTAANRLLLKHNLDRLDVTPERDYALGRLGRPMARIPLERKLLAGVLQDFFFVRVMWVGTRRPLTGQSVSLLEAMGEPHNLDIAEHVHDFVLGAVDRLWAAYRSAVDPTVNTRRARHDYRVGVLMGFREHLEGGLAVCREEGLVWLGDPVLEELQRSRFPSTSMLRGGRYRAGPAHGDGRRDGRRIRVRPTLGGDGADRRGVRGLLD